MNNYKIVIAGGSGFIGTGIADYFCADNQIVILTRNGAANNNGGHHLQHPNIQYVQWDAKTLGVWATHLDGADILINMTGKSVNCRYTKRNKAAIFSSRLDSTAILGQAVRQATRPPRLWINASSATIYRHATDRPQDELTGEIKDDFSVQVCKQWEQVFYEQRTPFTRKVALRMAIVLGPGGVMEPYCHLLKWSLGGQQGNGKQMYSWVHLTDLCRLVDWILEHEEIEGTYNCSSPKPVTNHAFMQTLRQVAGHKIGLPAPAWMLKMGAAVIGTETELLLKSRWVVPAKLLQAGFSFQFPVLKDAVTDIFSRLPRKKYDLF
jgi:uncharacterized protein